MRVRFAVRVLYGEFVRPLDAGQLFADAWRGATAALLRAGADTVPPAPAYPPDLEVAAALHTRAFPALERLAQGRLSDRQLIDAALTELAAQRHDCHTSYQPPQAAGRTNALLRGRAKQLIGVQFSASAPLSVVAVTPGSAAEAAGLRRGQRVLAINGAPVGDRTPAEALQPLVGRNEQGLASTFSVAAPGEAPFDVTLTPEPVPLVIAVRLPGNLGLLRFDTFEVGDAQYAELRRDLERFEAEGVRGWVIDLRFNGGGLPPDRIASLFVPGGRLWSVLPRDGALEPHDATGDALAVQRPLVFLVSHASASSAEILPAVMQALGRARVVGEQTAGCVGVARFAPLLDGSQLEITTADVAIGADGRRLHGRGVTPDIAVAPDEQAANDPQLLAAIRALQP